jgi:hypothetical protein
MHYNRVIFNASCCITDESLNVEIRLQLEFKVLKVEIDHRTHRDCHWQDRCAFVLSLMSALDQLQSMHDSTISLFCITHRLPFVRNTEAKLCAFIPKNKIRLVRELRIATKCV